jgi:hypothetical protein
LEAGFPELQRVAAQLGFPSVQQCDVARHRERWSTKRARSDAHSVVTQPLW